MKKRMLSLLLVAALLIGALPTAAFANEGRENQVVTPGGVTYYDENGMSTDQDKAKAILDKTVTATDVENQFRIDLDVKTPVEIQESFTASDADVVLVMDVSGSMGYCSSCGQSESNEKHALTHTCPYEKEFKQQTDTRFSKDDDDRSRCENCGQSQNEHHIVMKNGNPRYYCKRCDQCEQLLSEHEVIGNKSYCKTTFKLKNGTSCSNCGKAKSVHTAIEGPGYHIFGTRMNAAIKSATEFVTQYSGDASGAQRNLALVTYSGDAAVTLGWQDVSTKEGKESMMSSIASLQADGGTNTHGGLMLARNLLTKRDNTSYVILLTDGAPTYAMVNNYQGLSPIEREDYIFSSNYVGNGSDTTDATRNPAAKVAKEIKNGATDRPAAKFYTICYDHNPTGTNASWLKNSVSSGEAYALTPGNEAALELAFETIVKQIKSWAEVWTVTDPMGDFIRFDSLVDPISGEKMDFSPTGSANFADNTLNWDLKLALNEGTEDMARYRLSYLVTLENHKMTAAELPNSVRADKDATLTYMMLEEISDVGNTGNTTLTPSGDKLVASFAKPEVKSLAASLSFTKVNSNQQPILATAENKATFSLSGDNFAYANSASTNGTGVVDFATIPSGHSYVLAETAAPSGFVKSDETWTVTVANGKATSVVSSKDNAAQKLDALTFVNAYDPQPQDKTITKVWQDATGNYANQVVHYTLTGIDSVTNQKVVEKTGTITAGTSTTNTWKTTLPGMPTVNVQTGNTILYSVSETPIAGYTTKIDSLTITNTLVLKRNITVDKVWQDADLANRPAVEIILMQNDSPLPAKTLAKGQTRVVFENVDIYDEKGQAYTYTVTEKMPENAGYTALPTTGSAEQGFTITNRVNQEEVTISGEKTWQDQENAAGLRPESITLTLMAGTQALATTTASAATDWTYSFTQDDNSNKLSRYSFAADGTCSEIVYTVTEAAVGNYATTSDGYNFTNTITGKTSVSVEKVWIDVAGATHEPVQVQLMADGVASGEPVALTNTHTWSDLDQYTETGKRINYTVTEQPVENYTANISNDLDGGDAFRYTITNAITDPQNIAVSGTKIWQQPSNIAAPAITIKLLADGADTGKSVTLQPGETTYSFTGLAKYRNMVQEDESTVAIPVDYTVQEVSVPGYRTAISVDQDPGDNCNYTITNTITGTTRVDVTKLWKDVGVTARPTVTVTLSRQVGSEASSVVDTKTLTNDAAAFTGLDKYDAQGRLYTYTVKESCAGYSSSISANQSESDFAYTITNTQNQAYTTVSGTKTWLDNDNAYNTRPASITITLHGGTQVGRTITLDGVSDQNGETEPWTYSFQNLPLLNEDRTQIYSYTVSESPVDGYNATVSGNNFINTLRNENTQVTVRKEWVKPETVATPNVTINLLRNGTEINSHTLTGGASEFTFENLPKYDENQVLYTYTVEEEAVTGYTGLQEGTYFRNTIDEPSDVTVSGTKNWVVGDSDDHFLPDAIAVQLLADGQPVAGKVATVKAGDDGQWTYSFENLPRYNESRTALCTYSVMELDLEGAAIAPNHTVKYGGRVYTVTYAQEGYDITNTLNVAESDVYSFRVDRYYTDITDGVRGTPVKVDGTTENGLAGRSLDALTAQFDTTALAAYLGNTYTFRTGAVSIGADASELKITEGANTISVEKANQAYVISLSFDRTVTTPPSGGDGGGGGGGGNPGIPNPPTTDIPENETPLDEAPVVDITEPEVPMAALPEENDVIIADEDVPLGDLPMTGTERQTPLPALLTLLGALATTGLSLLLGKKKED